MLPTPEVPTTADERSTLTALLDEQRSLLLWKLEGLDEEQARRPMVDSGTSMLGLVKHLAWVERYWFVDIIGGGDVEYPWTDEDPDADFRIEPDETIDEIRRLYVDAVGEANAVIAAAENLDVTGQVRTGVRSLRWVLLHMVEETARHLGHADIIREQLDGTTGYGPQRPPS